MTPPAAEHTAVPAANQDSKKKKEEKDDCRTRIICIDYVNECGMWYGG
jgi:hypothetical protein